MANAQSAPVVEGIAIREIAPQDYLGLRFTCGLDKVGREVQEGYRKLYEHLAKAQSQPSGPPFLIASEPKGGVMHIEIGAPCTPAPPPGEGLYLGRLEGGRAAVALYRGPYDKMGSVYEQIFQWIGRHGYRPAGAAREVYLNGPDEAQGPEDYRTELVVPIA